MGKLIEHDETDAYSSEEEISRSANNKNSEMRRWAIFGALLIVAGVFIMLIAYFTISYEGEDNPKTITYSLESTPEGTISTEISQDDGNGLNTLINTSTTPITTINPTAIPTPISTVIALNDSITDPKIFKENIAQIPKGKIVYSKVVGNRFTKSDIEVNSGDEVLWDSYDDTTLTIVELDNKIDDITLKGFGRAKYQFTMAGNYRFGLFYKSTQISRSTQNINVIVNVTQ